MPQDAIAPADALRQAEAAANDAASDARAEALKRSGTTAPAKGAKGKTAAKAHAAEKVAKWHQFDVDVWITNFNDVEFGFWRRDRNKAKSRQFTSDMDIFADITENGERTGLIGYREELWKKSKDFDRRLVFKLFGEKLNWHATMDLMLGRSVQETIGARGIPVTSFAVNTNDHEQVVYIQRSANKWPLMPEHFSFFLMEDHQMMFYRIKQDLFSFGRDYSVYDATGKKVAILDGRLFTLGGHWTCRVLREHKDSRMCNVLKLFCGMLVFNPSCRKHVKRLAREVAAGRLQPKLQRQEADLYMNPRRVR
jgi:hypothetical protein